MAVIKLQHSAAIVCPLSTKEENKMNQKFIQKTLLSSLTIGLLAFSNINANAMGFQKNINDNGTVSLNGLVVSDVAFYEMLDNANKVSLTFGMPDSISTLKNADGNQEGVIWTYKNSVKKGPAILDANFVFVAGEFKYVTLSK
jgi:hypothetical protein|tara:strand:+ start:1118 stop:1546 length:429 start_codon:yes stop_codon:yes gene_type:complete